MLVFIGKEKKIIVLQHATLDTIANVKAKSNGIWMQPIGRNINEVKQH